MEENKANGSGGGGEVVIIPNSSLSEMTDDIIASAERRIANVEKIISLALKITTENDWVDQNGKPYLTSSGAEKIARLFGVCWSNIKTDKIQSEDEKGRFYFYQTSGIFSLRNDKVEAIGTCSSKDQFFAKKKEKNSDGSYETVLKPISEVDETNIMKASYSNCVANGITRLLGLRNLTWEQVQKSGVSKDKVASVKYASGGAGGGIISEPQAKRLFAILQNGSAGESDKRQRNELLHSFISLYLSVQSTKEIKTGNYETACAVAEHIAKKGTLKGIEQIHGVPVLAKAATSPGPDAEKAPLEAYQ